MELLRICTLLLTLACTWQSGPILAAEQPGGPSFLTNDLSGWQGLIADHWTFKDGALIGVAPQGLKFNTFLCSKQKYSDFELKFQVWLIGANANSGVQIRSEVFDAKHFAVRGPQCDMGQVYWASLYGEHFGGAKNNNGLAAGGMMKQAPADLVKRVLKEGGFNDYYIKCVGKHVTIKLNGQTTVDDDFPAMPPEGIIAWQIHAGPPMVAIFRNIAFTDLGKTR
jgi:3-keto-disaccharide hydrolase